MQWVYWQIVVQLHIISLREDQDAFAIESYKRSAKAWSEGKFSNEVIPVSVPQRRGDDLVISEDEEFKKRKNGKNSCTTCCFH